MNIQTSSSFGSHDHPSARNIEISQTSAPTYASKRRSIGMASLVMRRSNPGASVASRPISPRALAA